MASFLLHPNLYLTTILPTLFHQAPRHAFNKVNGAVLGEHKSTRASILGTKIVIDIIASVREYGMQGVKVTH
ncbi:hypothetical protein I315_04434 [Cryptococcus gattii Ru294]|nr:hypothetical protein I315_04434 [Cryptococcus gattii Ru294]